MNTPAIISPQLWCGPPACTAFQSTGKISDEGSSTPAVRSGPAPARPRARAPRAALVAFTEPFQFPPTMHQAAILAEAGWEVEIFGIHISNFDHWTPPPGVRVRYLGEVRRGAALRAQYAAFMAWLAAAALARRYDAVIGYDFAAARPARWMARLAGAAFVYHNHDLAPMAAVHGAFYKWAKRGEFAAARAADLVVFPQRERARIFKAEAALSRDPSIVFNCPRADWLSGPAEGARQAPPPEFDPWRASRESDFRVVLYQGQLAEHRGLGPLIDSIPLWNFKGGVVIVGRPLEPGIVESLAARAERLGVRDRVLLLPSIPHDQLAALTRRCDVGIGVLNVGEAAGDDPAMINLRALAGASNKIFEYMAAGIPIVTAGAGGFDELIQEPRHGLLCDGSDPAAVAAALNRLFGEPGLAAQISDENRRAFATEYNYDAQFAPILRALGERIKS